MKRFKTFEEFVISPSKKPIDFKKIDLGKGKKEEEKEEKEKNIPELSGTTVDSKGVIHIANWKTY